MRSARAGTIVVAAGCAAVLVAMAGAGDYTLYVLALVVVQAIAILSLNLLMGYAGQVSLGQASFVGIGAFAAAQLATWGAPFPVALVGGPVLSAIVATIVGLPSLRIRGLQVAATTLAFGVTAERLLFTRPWDVSSGTGLAAARPVWLVGGRAFLLLALSGLVVVLLLDRSVRKSRVGRAFAAVRDREDTAAARGIDVGRTKLLAYAISGFYAGVAGSLFAFLLERVTPESFTVWHSLGMVAAVVVGGLGSWTGAIVAGAMFTGVPELLRPLAGYAPLAGAVMLAAVPAIRPEGMRWLLDRRIGPRTVRPQIGTVAEPPVRALSLAVPVTTLLCAEGVGVRFGGLVALHDVALEVRRGEIAGLIGPNGAGKSTFFDCISGTVKADSGSIVFRDRELLSMPATARASLGIARTFQQVGLSPKQTVWENLLAGQHEQARYGLAQAILRTPATRRTERVIAARARTALELIGIEHLADVTVGSLSHGNQRLAEVSAAVATMPELLLLDEPFAGVGPDESEELAQRLVHLRDELDLTILVIEHDVPLVARLCDFIYCFAEGTVLASGTANQIQTNDDVIEHYIGSPLNAVVAS